MGLIKSNKIGEGAVNRASAATALLCAGALWAAAIDLDSQVTTT